MPSFPIPGRKSFKDMENNNAASKKGYQKIKMTCQLARYAGLDYVWVDTCCIDKSSSAELSEAINSMFRWYQRAEVCYAYLSDLSASASVDEALSACRWFTRSWTLQELIAPEEVIFIDQDWEFRGSKYDQVDLLSHITGVDRWTLENPRSLYSQPVAVRMSWAANREATRVEDIAYSLLGIFDLNMPLLYGEEEKAFRKLQEEIIKSTDDLSMFAWRNPSLTVAAANPTKRVFCSVLADSPSAFATSGYLLRRPRYAGRETSVSNIGIKTKSPILLARTGGTERYILPLDCFRPAHLGFPSVVAIKLRKCGPHRFLREDPSSLDFCDPAEFTALPIAERYLLTHLPISEIGDRKWVDEPKSFSEVDLAYTRPAAMQIRASPGITAWDMWSGGRYDTEDNLFFMESDGAGDCAVMKLIVTIRRPEDRPEVMVDFQCILYAMGWGPFFSTAQFQCSLVEYDKFRKVIDELHSEMTASEYHSSQLRDRLIDFGIPRSYRAVFEIPETPLSAIVSLKPVLVDDQAICRSEFWRLNLSCEICYSRDVGQVEPQQWDTGGRVSFQQVGPRVANAIELYRRPRGS
ncbi:hypothetical protein H2200_013267 [Cladophialophora chaetospira]|uniref:Heterokaryon incompatibility domain-containing protein n=1 Tax=Cladophialophora chaetospira TaxID=386627 RepID=A0AA38UE26_9EURO|nr:hypothetical protein H2200_013267 [Cladophialophora chaetospira]